MPKFMVNLCQMCIRLLGYHTSMLWSMLTLHSTPLLSFTSLSYSLEQSWYQAGDEVRGIWLRPVVNTGNTGHLGQIPLKYLVRFLLLFYCLGGKTLLGGQTSPTKNDMELLNPWNTRLEGKILLGNHHVIHFKDHELDKPVNESCLATI